MNQVQRNHAMNRINSITRIKISAIRLQCTKGHDLDNVERVALIRSGRVKLKTRKELKSVDNCYQGKLETVFDFSKWDPVFDKTRFDKLSSSVNLQSQRLRDEIMLGDAQIALDLIRDFEKAV